MPLRILSYNIRFGGTGREREISEVIRSAAPDVVMLQEATNPAVIASLAESTGMSHFGARAGLSTGFLSRAPVDGHTWHHPPLAKHAFLELVLPNDYGRLYGLHLRAWFSNWSERRRVREIRALLEAIKDHQDGFHAIAGDFNALAPDAPLDTSHMPRWIQAMVWASGRDIARETIRVMLSSGYVDAWPRLHPASPGTTFPTWNPHVRLDYLFTPERYGDRLTRCEVLRDAPNVTIASDHFPLLIEIADAGP